MKVAEALRVLKDAPPAAGGGIEFGLAVGFTPLHLATLLAAHLQQRVLARRVTVATGLYGDLFGTLDALAATPPDAAAVVIEWADLDPRLDLRMLGSWRPEDLGDIGGSAERRAAELGAALGRTAARLPLAVAMPTLPLPPIAHASGWLLARPAATLRRLVAALAEALAGVPGIRLLDPQRLDRRSPLEERFDVRAYLATGFPYRVPHAALLAELLAGLMRPPAPKKGLITDLDDTLWRGVLGEDGPEGVSWNLDRHAQHHGLYQQLLHALAASGVLVAVASKADPDVVEQGLAAPGLVLPRGAVFPVEAGWGPKSEAVGRILAAWNVAPDSVVFVDDSPAELAEVQAAHPDVECIPFPGEDGIVALLERLRDLFGRERLAAEDALRLASLRDAAARMPPPLASGARQDAFLAGAGQELTCLPAAGDPRPLELVNKTNQFNLNGRRWSEREWQALLARDDALAVSFAYRDKYGPLGKVAVVAGRRAGATLHVDAWVLSCRAFSRRIEWAALAWLFEGCGLDELVLDYQPTPRNHLVRDFLAGLLGSRPDGAVRVARAVFAARHPALHFQLGTEAA